MFPLLVAFTVSDLDFSFKVDVQHLVLNLMNIIHFTGQLGLMKFCCFQEDMFKDYQISQKRSRKVNLISRYFILDRLCRLCLKVTKDHIQIVFFLLAEKGCWSHPKGFCIDMGLHIFFWNSEKFKLFATFCYRSCWYNEETTDQIWQSFWSFFSLFYGVARYVYYQALNLFQSLDTF